MGKPIWHLLGCILPIAAIFLLPLFGVSGRASVFVFIILMFGCHLFMMRGHGGGSEDGLGRGEHRHGERLGHLFDTLVILAIAQSWSVLSGAAPEVRAREALEAAESELVRDEDGIVRLLWPPFDATLRDPGYIKAYPPGVRENGGQYTHAAAWLGLAFTRIGEPDHALRILRLINPIGHATTREEVLRYRVEPYVLAADVAGVPPHVGRGGWTWYTGAAAWTWRLGIEGLLGIRRVDGGVRFDPCLPTSWGRVEARIRGPAGALVVSIEDPDGVGSGVVDVEVDGAPLRDAVVRLPEDGRDRRVVVRLRRSARACTA